jgi:hypothetical protein
MPRAGWHAVPGFVPVCPFDAARHRPWMGVMRGRQATAGYRRELPGGTPVTTGAGILIEQQDAADREAVSTRGTVERWGGRAHNAPNPSPLRIHTLGRRSANWEHSSLLTLVGDEPGAAPLPASGAGREVNPWSERPLRCAGGTASAVAARPSSPSPRWSRAWPSARRPSPGRCAAAEHRDEMGHRMTRRRRGSAAGAPPPGPICSGLVLFRAVDDTGALPPAISLRGGKVLAWCPVPALGSSDHAAGARR